MQGIVLAIIISTLSPEGMNGATAALCLSAKLLGLLRAPASLLKHIQCTSPQSCGRRMNHNRAFKLQGSCISISICGISIRPAQQ